MLWGLQPVKPQAAYNIALESLRRQIHVGLLLPDERLPAERKLADDFSISRVTLREALRVLEGNKYIRIRRGPQGGAFIATTEALQHIAKTRQAFDRGGMMRVLEFREANEFAAVRLAAARIGLPEIKRMRQALSLIAQAQTSPELKQAETIFRLAMADASHNPHLSKAIEEGLDESFLPFLEGEVAQRRDEAEIIHRNLLGSLEAGDVSASSTILRSLFDRDWSNLRSPHAA